MDRRIQNEPPTFTKPSRLPRYQRVNEPPKMVLTARDVKILQQVDGYRWMTRDQIERLLFSEHGLTKTSQVRKRLKLLFHHGYLDRIPTPIRSGVWAWRPVYRLTKKGAEIVGQSSKQQGDANGGRHSNQVRRKTELSFLFLEHMLLINDVRIAITLSAQARGCQIEKWLDDHTLKGQQMREYVTIDGDKIPFIPDAYFILSLGNRRAHFFLELDRATLGLRKWTTKIRAYQSYIESGKYQARYQTRSLRVLTITPSRKRLEHLIAATEKAGGDQLFWFTSFDLAIEKDILFHPIWTVAQATSVHPLIE